MSLWNGKKKEKKEEAQRARAEEPRKKPRASARDLIDLPEGRPEGTRGREDKGPARRGANKSERGPRNRKTRSRTADERIETNRAVHGARGAYVKRARERSEGRN